jgi:hypothetical protein
MKHPTQEKILQDLILQTDQITRESPDYAYWLGTKLIEAEIQLSDANLRIFREHCLATWTEAELDMSGEAFTEAGERMKERMREAFENPAPPPAARSRSRDRER